MRLALVAIVVGLCASAGAQPADPTREAGYIGKDVPVLEIDDCPPPPDVPAAKLQAIGGEHYARGEVLYQQGDYKGAVIELAAAYCIHPGYYNILKDIGLSYERELDYEKAIAYLERYVIAIPQDAKPANACAEDPQIDRKEVLARISALASLDAKIRVETEPPDARITISNDAGESGFGATGDEISVAGGTYDMKIERSGYHTITRRIHAEIGKPYTFFEKLEPVKGHLRVRVVPGDARLYLDREAVGTGAFETELAGGKYTLVAEADDHVTVTRDIEVLPGRDTTIAFELPPKPEYGHKQLLGYAPVAAGTAAGLLAGGASDNALYDVIAVTGGVAGGIAAVYFGTPDDLPLGTSSLTITSSLIGLTAGTALAFTFTDNANVITPLAGTGIVVGAGVGYYIGRRTNPTAGDAAIINSGAVWGSVASGLLAVSFGGDPPVSAGIVLSGLAMGTTGGVLLQRYFTVSRGHAALIDASGVVGIVGGLATLSVFSRANNGTTATNSDERTSNFALAGLAAGLIVGGVLTRHMDEPKLAVTPSINRATTARGSQTTTFGLAGQF
ncbi:MAG TPA: PEGA domain-containing protein [Kofleriaceae bacterium]|nr:PEGA domain-containing protein [Kofleriaceae bacterium]